MPVLGDRGPIRPSRPKARVKKTRQSDERLRQSVARARAKPRVKADTGDITRAAAPGQRGKAALKTATADLAQTAGRAKLKPRPRSYREQLGRELAGRGLIAHVSEQLGEEAAKGVSKAVGPILRTKGLPEVPKVRRKGGKTRVEMASALPINEETAGNLAKDIVNLPAQAIPSLYVPAAAAVEAARGKPQRAKQLWRDIKAHDPVYALVTGHPGEARKRAEEHPGFTALELYGAKGATGRGITRAQEVKAVRQGRPRASVTARTPGKVPGTNITQPRTYSRDAEVRRRQRQRDRDQRQEARALRVSADQLERQDPGRNADRIADMRRRANAVDPDRADMAGTRRGRLPKPVARPSYIRHRARQREASNELRRRQGRAEADAEVRAALEAGGRKADAADVLYAQAIVGGKRSLRAYLKRIEAEHDNLTPARRADNRALQKAIRDALDRGVDAESMRKVAAAYERAMAPRTTALQRRGMIGPDTAEMAPLVPHAVTHMGARMENLDPLRGAEQAARATVRQAKAARARTGRRAATAQRTAAREEGRTRLMVEQQGRRDERTARALEQQAQGLVEQAKALDKRALINTQGKRAIDPFANRAPTPRQQAKGQRARGPKVGSQRYRTGQRQARRAAELRKRADALRADAAAIRGTPGTRPQAALGRLERSRAATLEAERAAQAAREQVPKAKATLRSTRKARREARGPVLAVNGRKLEPAEIRASIGDRPVAYVTQAPRVPNPHYVDTHRPPQVGGRRRTGKATLEGTFRADPEVMRESVVRAQGPIDAFDGFKATIDEFANPQTKGRLRTKADADRKGAELEAATGMKWRAVRINPFAGRQEQLRALVDHADSEDPMLAQVGDSQPLNDALMSALKGEDGEGPWALIPEEAAAEFEQFASRMGAGTGAKVLQIIGQSFRSTVLALSVPWLTGNVVEATIRTALFGAGPRSYRAGRALFDRLEQIDPRLAADLRRRATPGGLMASAKTLHVRRGHEQFQGTMVEPFANALHRMWETPGPRHAADAWKVWTNWIFGRNGLLESQFQTAMLGKAIRTNPLFHGAELRKLTDVVDAAARGMAQDPNKVAAAADIVTRAYGRYHGHSPGMRWQIAMYTPFVPWFLNAVKFVADVLPRDHPAALGLLAATENATDEWRKSQGLDLFMKGALPGFMQGSIPLDGGRHLPLSRFTPFGAFGDPLGTAKRQVLPQFSGVLAAFDGEDWKGAKLRNSDGTPMSLDGKARVAAQEFAGATIPVVMLAERVANPGTQNPFRSYGPGKPKAKAKPRARSLDSEVDALLGGGSHTDTEVDQLLGGP